MTNTLDADLAIAEAAIPPDPVIPAPPGTDALGQPEPQANCSDLTPGLVRILAVTALPQWELTEPELEQLGGALGECLDQLFPGGMSGKYACWLRLVACSAMICATRAASNGGKLPGLGPRPKVSSPPPPQTPSEADPQQLHGVGAGVGNPVTGSLPGYD